MRITNSISALVIGCIALTGCQVEGAPGTSAQPTRTNMAPSFVQAACADCHGVERNMISPNPAAPAFSEIANREGVDRENLIIFLRDAHNYPEQMDFDLDENQVKQIAQYLTTLQTGSHERPAS